jgi:repressor LexA
MTTRSKEVLAWIREFIAANGYSPTVREICDGFGWASTNAVMPHLYRLRRHGLVKWQPGHTRTMRLTEESNAAAS